MKRRCVVQIASTSSPPKKYISSYARPKIVRGRWASAAIGAGIARRRMGNEMDQQSQAYEAQQQQAQQQEIERLKAA